MIDNKTWKMGTKSTSSHFLPFMRKRSSISLTDTKAFTE
jgi:hypothetical protein